MSLPLPTLAGFHFLTSSVTQGVESIRTEGDSFMRLGLAAYSLRDYFIHSTRGRSEADPSKRISMMDFVDYCADQRCPGAELTSYFFPPDTDMGYLLKLKRHAFLRGITLTGSAVGNKFTLPYGEERDQQMAYVKKWIDYSAIMGIPHLRVFAGPKGELSHDKAVQMCIESLKECCDYGGEKGVFLGIENHGGIVAEPDELLRIIDEVSHPWLGINLDSANFHTDDPYADFEKCAGLAVNVQLKTEVRARGQQAEPADLKRYLGILRKASFQGFVVLEYEAAEDPWIAIPIYLKVLSDLL